ncbi:MAG: DUF1638 domain-containing protein [Rhodospirillaceae bacterium]|nr:DUF1638 domain-containing protein [Rhodospirillaceae bacterium]
MQTNLVKNMNTSKTLFITCGALAREVIAIKNLNKFSNMEISCLPASWHNSPEKITPAIRAKIQTAKERFDCIFVIYGDCGTGGELDELLKKEGVSRIPGPHCYEFFMGKEEFDETHADEPGCFYLTDYLTRHFDRIIFQGLGLDRFPELLSEYFQHYKKLIYIAQTNDSRLESKAIKAAHLLGLKYERRMRGYSELGKFVALGMQSRY